MVAYAHNGENAGRSEQAQCRNCKCCKTRVKLSPPLPRNIKPCSLMQFAYTTYKGIINCNMVS
jgi:hypothetical protein